MKLITATESKFIRQFQDMVASFEINNQVKFGRVALEIDGETGETGYDITFTSTAPTETPDPATTA